VVVIGCGSAGLLCGATLATRGHKVAMFDAHYVAGGCATQFSRKSKFHFDVGLHYIGDCHAGGKFPEMLSSVGIDDVEFVPMDQDGYDTLRFPDFELKIPASLELYRERLVELFPSEVTGIDRYVRLLQEVEVMQDAMEQMHQGKTSKWGLAFTAFTSGRLLGQYQNATLAQFLDTCTTDKRLRAAITGQSGNYGIPPAEVSTMLHCGLVNHYFKGAYYPKGGGQRMSDRLAEVIEANGGTVCLRRKIEQVLVENGKAVGVRTETRRGDAYEVRAKAVVSAGDFSTAMTKLLPKEAVPQEVAQKVSSYRNAEGLLNTCIALNVSAEELHSKFGMRAANYWCFDAYDADEIYQSVRDAPAATGAFGCYITSASLKDPQTRHAPEGMSTVEVLTVVPQEFHKWGVTEEAVAAGTYRKDPKYRELKAKVEQQMVDRLEQQFPQLTQHIAFRESSTPLSHNRFTAGGTAYGLAATPSQFMNKRPGFRGPVDSLFLCGHSTRTGHGIAGAMMGGQRVAGYVEKHLA